MLNQTFLNLLPHAELTYLDPEDQKMLVFDTLDSLGMLDFEAITNVRRRVIELGKEKGLSLGNLEDTLGVIDDVVIRKVHETSPLPLPEEPRVPEATHTAEEEAESSSSIQLIN